MLVGLLVGLSGEVCEKGMFRVTHGNQNIPTYVIVGTVVTVVKVVTEVTVVTVGTIVTVVTVVTKSY